MRLPNGSRTKKRFQGAAIVNLYACGLQLGFQPIHVCTLNAEVPQGIRPKALLFDREVKP